MAEVNPKINYLTFAIRGYICMVIHSLARRAGAHTRRISMARRRKHSSRSHARHTTALSTRPNVVVVRSGGGGRRRRAARVVVRGARRAARGVARHALPVTGLGLGGAALGWLQSEGHLDAVPAIGGSKMIGLGVLGYFATRMTKIKYIREAGAAAVAIAGFQFGQSHGGGARPAVHGPFQAGMGWGAGG